MEIDSLKTLMDNKQYELVVRLTDSSDDVYSLFMRINALVALGKINEALDVINQKKKILELDVFSLAKIHIELLCMVGQYPEAYKLIGYYSQLPYQNQKTEELFGELYKFISDHQNRQFAQQNNSVDSLKKKLLSADRFEVFMAMEAIKKQPIEPFLPELKKLMVYYPTQDIRSIILLHLYEIKYDKEIQYKHIDKIINVTPSLLNKPRGLLIEDIKKYTRLFNEYFHNPSLSEKAVQLYSLFNILFYPEQYDLSDDEIVVIFGHIAKMYIKSPNNDLKNMCENMNLSYEKIEPLYQQIKKVIDSNN